VKKGMLEIRVSITLPYALGLAEGDYLTAQVGEIIRVSAPTLEETNPQTVISATFQNGENLDPDERPCHNKVYPGAFPRRA
jgi:hypothetical protein